ncbi:unnamed protein product, partial [Lymnaea stagnalis]
ISAFIKIVLDKYDKDVKAMPLSNNIVHRRLDEMYQHIEIKLFEKHKTRKFAVQIDESNL